MTTASIEEVTHWLERHASKLPPGLTLHRGIWQLAARSLKEVARSSAWEHMPPVTPTDCNHRWLVPGTTPVIYDYRGAKPQGLMVEFCDHCLAVRWFRPEWLADEAMYKAVETPVTAERLP